MNLKKEVEMKMSRLTHAIVLFGMIVSFRCGVMHEGDYFIKPVPFTEVEVKDDFWSPRMETNRRVTIPYAFQQCEETHRIDNFAVAGSLKEGHQEGYRFNDSDVYKVIEGAAYAIHIHRDAELEAYVDGVIDLIASAQEEDGYLYTAKTAFDPENPSVRVKDRWDNIRDDHELYCVGHMYEAAVAYYQATGKRKLLEVALKNADLIDSVFGPDGMRYPSGHQEIEIGLVKLYRLTGEKKYLNLAKFFLDQRGDSTGHALYGEYAQDHMPVVDQTKAVGHAVRAAYMYTGMADVAALTGNKDYSRAIQRIWEDVVGNKLYVTGGIGASGGNEGFGGDYHLPNASAYCETCASIANAMWNHRLFLMTGDAKYMDVVERVIYNSFLSGISMEGDRFFYPNRLETFTGAERAPWFGCACCPSNVVRFVPSIPGYAYAHHGSSVYVNLFLGGEAKIPVRDQTVRLSQKCRYPWDGDIRISVDPEKPVSFTLHVRIPGWAQGRPVPSGLYRYMNSEPADVRLKVNGVSVPLKMESGYTQVERQWHAGDEVVLTLPMPIRRVVAYDSVEADRGKVALERGPIVFCAEGYDNPDDIVRNILLTDDAPLATSFEMDLLRGVQVIRGRVLGMKLDADGTTLHKSAQALMMIPYYSWAHRGLSPMSVWLAREEGAAKPLRAPSAASMAKVTASFGPNPQAVNDQLEPQSSIDHEVPYFHWWPHKGTTEWIQYDFGKPTTISSTEVYWFDDTGMGECRIPKSWRLLYGSDENWIPVENLTPYEVEADRFVSVSFKPVTVRAVRLVIQSQEGWAGGIHEWRVK